MVDEYERKYGPVDRSEFDGEFVVPPELRNRSNTLNSRSLRLHGGLLSISRSRTFLSLPVHNNSRNNSIHSSVPDLSRSMPNTPNSSHKLALATSYDSVLEENEDENGENGKPIVKYAFTTDGVNYRRKSEDILSTKKSHKGYAKILVKARPPIPPPMNHSRQQSEPINRISQSRPLFKKPLLPVQSPSNGTLPRISSKWGNVR